MYGQEAPFVLPKALKRYYEGVLWSTLRYANAAAVAGTQNNLFFSTPLGMNGQGFTVPLSISETNISQAGMIPVGQAFTVYAVAAEPRYNDNASVCREDMNNLQYYSALVWKFLNTEIPIGPLNLIGQAGGLSGATADTGAAEGGTGGSRFWINSGFGQCWTYDTLAVLLPAASQFNVAQVWGSGASTIDGGITTADLFVRVSLIGTTMTAIPVG